MTATTHPTPPDSRRDRFRQLVARHPIVAFSVPAFALGWPLLALHVAIESTLVALAFTYVALLGSAVAVTALIGGRGAVRTFLLRMVHWRFGVSRWALVVLAIPVLTLILAGALGSLELPAGGWLTLATTFAYATFVHGALEVNLAEEAAWGGFVQTRLAARKGLVRGALLTAPLFVAMHLPMQFATGWTWASVGVGVIALLVVAPFFRYLIGVTLEATGGSILAIGVLHAAFNASSGFGGGWEYLAALLVLAVGVAVVRRVRGARVGEVALVSA